MKVANNDSQDMTNVLEEYNKKFDFYREFTNRLYFLIGNLLGDCDFTIHKIESRIKNRGSLEDKIQRKHYKYKELSEITDIIGLRIITVFEEDIEKVCQVIEHEFEIDLENSIDKRITGYDKFGYQSVHYIALLNEDRLKLNEYNKYKGIPFEIQIRSILQHAWADIQHDLGYKGFEIPDNQKRAFSRISALLEIADKEFNQIRRDILSYRLSVISKVKQSNIELKIDKISLEEFLKESNEIKELDKQICIITGRTYDPKPRITEDYIKILAFCEIFTLKDLFEKLQEYSKQIVVFAKHWTQIAQSIGVFYGGISILYLGYVLVAQKNDTKIGYSFIKIRISKDIQYYVDLMFETYRQVTAGNTKYSQ